MAKTRVIVYGTTPPKSVLIDSAATVGAQIGVNLLLPDGTLAKMSDFGATPSAGSSIDTTDDVDEGSYHLYFTDLRAQDAVGGILVDTATIDFTYTAGTSITADLKDLADSGTGSALVKITRDAKGRLSGTEAATTADLTEGSNLYFTNERAQDAIGAALVGTGNVPLTYDDAGNTISAALSTSVLASLALADSATQPGDLATVATSGAYADLSGLPTLGTAAATASTDYATAAQGIKADSALQSVVAGTGVSVDNTNPQSPVISATGAGSGDVVGPASATDSAIALFDGTTGKLLKDGGALNKAAVGLGNVDNTSDVNKPVSTAQAAADATKLSKSGDTGTGNYSFLGDSTFGLAAGGSVTIFNRPGTTVAGSSIQFSSPGGAVGIIGLNGLTSRCDLRFDANLMRFGVSATSSAPSIQLEVSPTSARPGADNAYSLGESSRRWSVVYAATGAINTSDARDKTAVEPLAAAELAAAADLSRAVGTYQWLESVQLKGSDARRHAGLTVQQAIAIMQTHGLDPFAYGFICYDQWDEQPEIVYSWPARDAVLDEAGNVITPAIEAGSEVTQAYRAAGDRYSFRTDELLLFMARGFTARLDALEAKA
jgi:hypothetical protein